MLERGQKVAINYAGWLEDGTEFVNTWLVPDSVTITIGASGLLPAFEEQLLPMENGTRRTFSIPCEKAYGSYDPAGLSPLPLIDFPMRTNCQLGNTSSFPFLAARRARK